MVKEAKGFGATIDEARENAFKNLGASDFDDVQYDVIAVPKKKVLGIFGGSEAEVRAYIELPDEKPKKAKNTKPNKKAEKPDKKTEKNEKIEKNEKSETAPKKEAEDFGEAVDQSEIDANSPAGKAVAYIKTVLAGMEIAPAAIKVAHRENGSLIILEGDDLSLLIGRRGETLDALQYLMGLAANNGGGHYKISLDICNYRAKREEALISLANRLAAQALKAGKCRTLEPMNPYERRIIHTAVQAIDGVKSGSFGEGNERRVVIAPEGVELRPRMNNYRSSDRKGRNRRDRSSRPSNVVASAPTREPKRDSDIPLYGKIN